MEMEQEEPSGHYTATAGRERLCTVSFIHISGKTIQVNKSCTDSNLDKHVISGYSTSPPQTEEEGREDALPMPGCIFVSQSVTTKT